MSGEKFEKFRCPIGWRIMPSICAECKQFNCVKNPKFKSILKSENSVEILSKPIVVKEFSTPEHLPEVKTEVSEVKTIDTKEGFICDICGKIFKVKIALAGHKRSHKVVSG